MSFLTLTYLIGSIVFYSFFLFLSPVLAAAPDILFIIFYSTYSLFLFLKYTERLLNIVTVIVTTTLYVYHLSINYRTYLRIITLMIGLPIILLFSLLYIFFILFLYFLTCPRCSSRQYIAYNIFINAFFY